MSDRDALLAAVCAQPDDDTVRLVLADYLEENGEAGRAAFIRAQVELARTPPWEPFAVRCRWREPEVVTGKEFLKSLPRVDGVNLAWSSEPFHRGFGWSLGVRHASLWAELAEPVFACEPVGRVHFWSGTLDDWRRVAASGSVSQFRELVFNLGPNEPLLALRDREAAGGVTDVHFLRASGAGMPEVLEDLLPSALGRGIRGLHFRTGYESLRELVGSLNSAQHLQRLSFSNMGITPDRLRQLLEGPPAATLEELHFRDEPLGGAGLAALGELAPAGLRDLTLSAVGVRPDGLEPLLRSERLVGLRRLNLGRNALAPRSTKLLSQSWPLAGLRSLDLSGCHVGDKGVRHISRAAFWPNLVELDLRGNSLSGAGVRHLLDAPVPAGLTALVLDGESLGAEGRGLLARKYGAAAVFAAPEVRA